MARTTKNLQDTEIKQAKAKPEDYKLMDGKGLFLLVKTSGAKIWRFRYKKPFTGKQTDISLGRYPELTLSQARAMREEYRALLAEGIDPLEHRQAQEAKANYKAENTFKHIVDKWFNEIYPTKAKPETITSNYKRLEIWIFPKIGGLPIEEIKPRLLVELYRSIGASNTLDKIHRLIMAAMNYAIKLGLIEGHNCDIAKEDFQAPMAKHHPTLKPSELPHLLAVMNEAYKAGRLEPNTLLAFNLTLLTGLRQKELTGLEWRFIEGDFLRVPASLLKQTRKLKEQPEDHLIPISPQIACLLDTIRQFNGSSPYLFPRVRNRSKTIGKDTVANALRDNGFQDKQDAHGLRALFRTYLTQAGISVTVAELAIAHHSTTAKGKLVATYDREEHLDELREAFEAMGRYCEQCGMLLKI